MPHLLTPRKGWENERLASYFLSRFCFVAHPTSIADDLGSDFFCTIFEIENNSGTEMISPRSSFAIQIKSSDGTIVVDNKIDYLMHLELPFFVGVVSQHSAQMKIYSAEFLPLLFSEIGRPDNLSLKLVANSDVDISNYYERQGGSKKICLKCPLVTTLNIDDDRLILKPKIETLLHICTRAHSNIAARVNEEHIFNFDGKGTYRIVAGSGSVNFFRMNFLKRLGEVFYNLKWVLDNHPEKFSISEFQKFESLFLQLKNVEVYQPIIRFASNSYEELKAKVNSIKAFEPS